MENSKDWEEIARNLKVENPEDENFQDWLNQNPENKKLFHQAKTIWTLTALPNEEYSPDINKGWDRLKRQIEDEQEYSQEHNIKKIDVGIIFKIAAVLVIVFGIGFFFINKKFNQELVNIKTGSKETKEILLPDGSRVWLNKESKLSYSKEFNIEDRIVNLSGEAFFEVKKADGETFTIFSNNAKTQVLGTQFNVRAYEDESEVEVTVLTGKVSFSSKKTSKSVLLEPGEKALLTKENSLVKTVSENKNEVAWKTKQLKFENTHLSVVLHRLEEYFGTSMETNNQDILKCRFTGNFENADLKQILEVLSVSVDIKYIKKENSYYFSGVGCKQ